MKIIHVTPCFYPAWAYGGIPRLSFHMAMTQARKGHDVQIVTTDALDSDNRQHKDGFKVEGMMVRVHRNFSNRAAYRHQAYLPRNLLRERKLVRGHDIMHIHGHRNLLNSALAFFGRRARIPIVLQPNGTLVNIESRRLFKSVYDILLGNRQVRATTGFIAVSDVEKGQFLEMGVPEERIRVIPNGVYIVSTNVKLDFKKHYGINGDYVLYLGKITPRKGIEHLVRALRLVRDKNLMLVIAGNDMGYLGAVTREVNRQGLSNRVIMTGLLTGEMKTAAYRGALYTAYVSRDEIFGLVPFESIICGTPVIVASDSGCGEWVSKARAGHVIPYGDARAIADVINGRDADEEEASVERGKKFIEDNLTWEKVTARVLDFYGDILGGSAP